MTGLAIARQLGLASGYVYEILSDPEGARVRARKDSYRGSCVDCGAATSGSEGRREQPRCRPCGARLNGARARIWTREVVIERIQEWAAEYGEPPAAPDWNPHIARSILGDPERAERFERDNRWPWATSVVEMFGSWNAAIEAAGFTPRAPHGGGGNQWRRRWAA